MTCTIHPILVGLRGTTVAIARRFGSRPEIWDGSTCPQCYLPV